jgi:hypothetical protein
MLASRDADRRSGWRPISIDDVVTDHSSGISEALVPPDVVPDVGRYLSKTVGTAYSLTLADIAGQTPTFRNSRRATCRRWNRC